MPLLALPRSLSRPLPRAPSRAWHPLLCLGLCLAAAALAGPAAAASLQPYGSEAEFHAAIERWRVQAQRVQGERRRAGMGELALSAAPPAAPAMKAQMAAGESVAGAAADATADGITNVQTAGVDEGGIVKRAGEHLVILRRGRLFTVRIGGDQLHAAAMTDAYAPGADPRGAWYDELLVSGSTVVVVGYSYARGGTEIGLFELAPDGRLAWRATHHLRSHDYYSSRNYASRLVGRTLVFYSPQVLQPWGPPPWQALPAHRRWGRAAMPGLPADFERILPATQVYRTDDEFEPAAPLALHTVTRCDLGQADLRCDASAVLGPPGRVFYVSAGSVYVWTTQPGGRHRSGGPAAGQPRSAVFRLPLDGSAPTALKTAGVPVDQMSFLEDGRGQLNVLLREVGDGEGMWGSEHAGGRLALLQVPLAAFGDGRGAAQSGHYRRLPAPAPGPLHNRYVGQWLLWGGSDGAWALRHADTRPAAALQPGHAVERIEALGDDALLVGSGDGGLQFSAVQLRRRGASLAGSHRVAGASQAETRSHGFYYRADEPGEGLLGLPVLLAGGREEAAPPRGGRTAASVVFLRHRDGHFDALGELSSQGRGPRDDACKASCVDWYGNARPLFIGSRVFALMGYELVEGTLASRWGGQRIGERRRLDFSPARHGARSERANPFD